MERAPSVKRPAASANVSTPQARSSVLLRKCDCGNHASGGTCESCAAEQRKRQVSRFAEHRAPGSSRDAAITSARVPHVVHDVLRASGHRLPDDVRAFMEPRFGLDFSEVRLHTDGEAARSSRAVGARAYTVGSHIVFSTGQFQPDTDAGRRLLAHELTHVVQQRHTTNADERPETISDPMDASEVEADRTAARVLAPGAEHSKVAPSHGLQPPSTAPIGDVTPPIVHGPGGALQRELSDEAKAGIVGGVVGGLGAGFAIAYFAGAFDRERFTTDQLIEYLNGLAVRGTPEDHRDSDNKARDVVRHWQEGDRRVNVNNGHTAPQASLTSIQLKRLLIREMLLGATTGDDELAIITILERSTPDDVLELLNPAHGVSVQQLDDKIGGANHDRLEAVLETKFPRGSRVRAQEGASSGCTARQGVMLSYARDAALRWVDNAIVALNRLPDTAVQQALDCRFPGASLRQRRQILTIFEIARRQLPTREYHCGLESGAGALEPVVITFPDGHTLVGRCLSEDAVGTATPGSPTPVRQVVLCGAFFGRDAHVQALTIVHESVHAAGIGVDRQYQPGCGLALDDALENADSYAYLAADLMTLTGHAQGGSASASLPSVTVGNFRNTGPVSDENQSELGQQIPGLGLDPDTGMNFMELRGDISGRTQGVQFDFRRTKEVAVWRKKNGAWDRVRFVPAGTDDDRFNTDEDLTPENNHIYSLDGPGVADLFEPLPPQLLPGADETVYKASFLESVEARVPPAGWTRVSNEFAWHSITWLERGNGLGWTRKAGRNEVEAGALVIGDQPPEAAPSPAQPGGNAPATAPAVSPSAPAPSPGPTPADGGQP
jgi:hypothetical protein